MGSSFNKKNIKINKKYKLFWYSFGNIFSNSYSKK